MPPGSIKAGKAPAKPVPPTAPGAHEAGLEYGEIAPDIAADNMAAHIGAEPEDMPPPCSASTKRPLTAEAFVRRAVDGTFEADLFALDDIPPKDPPRVRGQPSAYVAARELVLAFSNSAEHADLPGSASHCPINVDIEYAAAQPKAAAEDDGAEKRELRHASSTSSAARDPAVQPALRPGTRPPTRLDQQAWDMYVYQTPGSNTFYGAWGFDGKPARHDEFFTKEAKKNRAIPLADGRPTKEDAAMRRYEGLLRYGEGARISYALREFYLKQTEILENEMRAMLRSVRAIYETGACRWTVLRRLEQEPPRRLAQLVLLAAAPEQDPELHTFKTARY
ncbi:hypothetical protein Ctob_002482 [Chrysochromulina tobinii]|uniref:Uncharacterized protein n=1 Tax=Chrysochromulina tobinii TaxID=1460289 RepID=A0A0M0J8C8_9EUKA|nr:hypothetical protein Ctob_002482 [Chrysochromulina tobinii]|eukprot:KOO22448.1 hypothetical protein Ctob_002482 [Chrysochromulina sp. CCMP291]